MNIRLHYSNNKRAYHTAFITAAVALLLTTSIYSIHQYSTSIRSTPSKAAAPDSDIEELLTAEDYRILERAKEDLGVKLNFSDILLPFNSGNFTILNLFTSNFSDKVLHYYSQDSLNETQLQFVNYFD